jgi:hypothetical protein
MKKTSLHPKQARKTILVMRLYDHMGDTLNQYMRIKWIYKLVVY